VNRHDAIHVVRDDVVGEIWHVITGGPGHHGPAGLGWAATNPDRNRLEERGVNSCRRNGADA